MRKIGLLFVLTSLAMAYAEPHPRTGFQWEAVRRLAIQERGRLKPLDTFATESVQYLTGKSRWQSFSAIECLFSWLITYEGNWEKEQFIRVNYKPLKKEVGLDEAVLYFSPRELAENANLSRKLREAILKEQRKERLSESEKKAIQIQNQLGLLEAIVRGQAFTILPNPQGIDENWFSLAVLTEPSQLGPLPYTPEQMEKLSQFLKSILESYSAQDASRWNEATSQFANFVRSDLGGKAYPSVSVMEREVHYNDLRPFRWAWIVYVGAFVLLLIFQISKNGPVKVASFVVLFGAFGLHAYGFVLRCLIAGRPPVSNMYESVIWVAWGCVLFSLFIWMAYKNAVIPAAATVFAIVSLVLADNLPFVLDPSINPLEPVLRSNFWLTIHVLTITLSYAGFALSLCLGNVVLGNYLFNPKNTEKIHALSLYMYRSVQIGVVLLAAGTILGGVWADYSWGRFWGWDPKEVWALIALLLYLAVLHGKFTGWITGFGFVSATVFCFLGILMAWYGVNFVLGVGLHSYGFGSGGLPWVLGYIALQAAFVAAAYSRFRNAR